MAYQERYVAYAKAHGMTPDEMMEYDRIRCHGGVMCEYIIWICNKLAEYREINQSAFIGSGLRCHDVFAIGHNRAGSTTVMRPNCKGGG